MQTFYHILLSVSVFKVESKTILVEVQNIGETLMGKIMIWRQFSQRTCASKKICTKVVKIITLLRIHHQCQSGEVCTKSGICKALACHADIDCENEVTSPGIRNITKIFRRAI